MKRINCLAPAPVCALAVLVSSSALAADDYKGADALLTQITSAKGQAAAVPASPGVQWIEDAAAFRRKSDSLAPDEAARQWLALVDRDASLSEADLSSLADQFSGEGLGSALVSLLPGPAAWPALARMVDARPGQSAPGKAAFEAGLRLLAHTLVADPAGQGKALQALRAVKDPSGIAAEINIPSLEDALADESDNALGAAAAFRTKLAREKKEIEEAAETGQGGNFPEFSVPDLVTLLGEKEATPLLREAILLPQMKLTITGAETKRLAGKLALAEVANMKSAHWELACSLDGAPLFLALQKRFPDVTANTQDYPTARLYYFIHLIVSGHTDEAVEMSDNISFEEFPMDDLDAAGYTREVHDFLHDLLVKHPELPFWDEYIILSAKTGQTSQMLDLIRSVISRKDLSDTQLSDARQSFYLALLAADQIDEGIAELRKVISASGDNEQNGNSAAEKDVALARLGQLLGRRDLMEEGIDGAKKHLLTDPVGDTMNVDTWTSLADLLTEVGLGPEAEDVLGQLLGRLERSDATTQPGSDSSEVSCLAALMRVYFEAGRPDDVLGVLEKYPGWGAADLKDILTQDTDGFSIAEYSTHAASDDYYVGYMAAWALAQRGENAAALKIDSALLDQEGDFDPGFELLTRLSGQDAIPQLDVLARRDRFEQRPLVWKAQLQLDAGKLDDAEKTIRDAITIDPSDGQQGPGRRMREYAVLADVLDKKGDKEHADIYRGAVTAIRMSEHADRFYEAGLLTRAVKMYEDALTHFSDAYCIQSRLALRLSELGDNAGAEEHYRRAYELMPESFGRVESHCFGCERAFDGTTAQSIAEKVFTELAAKMPYKPQVHYLLGYLRKEEERYSEALPEFEEAVKLDPDYLNAWKEIGEVGAQIYLPARLRNEVAVNQVRLDPLQRHSQPDATNVTDLAGLWNAIAAAKSLAPAPPGPLLPLTASAAELKTAAPPAPPAVPGLDAEGSESDSERAQDPAGCISQNCFIAAANQILGELRQQ